MSDLRSILVVDDEPHVLSALERTLGEDYELETVPSAEEAVELMAAVGSFAVVVSDMRMPGLSGAELFAKLRQTHPDTVRILMTGYADLAASAEAVNSGQVFRFLCKPVSNGAMRQALDEALVEHRLKAQERELLETTLTSTVEALNEILSLASPTAFARSGLIKNYVNQMLTAMGINDRWEIELGASLCNLGCIAIPPEALDKIYQGKELSRREERAVARHPEIAARILGRIPRLENVAEIIRRQRHPAPDHDNEHVNLGARMLHAALTVDALVARGLSVQVATEKLTEMSHSADPALIALLGDYSPSDQAEVIQFVSVGDLQTFMILADDVRTRQGTVVLPKGRRVNGPILERLRNFHSGEGLVEPLRVRIPA